MNNFLAGCILTVSVGVAHLSQAQTEVIPDVHANAESLRDMDQGVELMNQGQFAKADTYFMRVLESVEVVPADLCFFFGKNSYHLNKYKQSIDWLNKYMELKGTRGRFFDQASEYLQLAKADYTNASKTSESIMTQRKARPKPQTIDCEQYPYVKCPVCNGDGVVIEPGRLGSLVYRSCPYSDESGRMKCEDYREYLQGNLTASPQSTVDSP